MRALILSSFVPLLGVGVLGIGLGYRSVSDLASFVLLWAIVVFPFVAVLAFGSHLANRWLGLYALWQFALGGFLAGSSLSLIDDLLLRPAHGGTPVMEVVTGGAIFGVVGAATPAVFWHQAIRRHTA